MLKKKKFYEMSEKLKDEKGQFSMVVIFFFSDVLLLLFDDVTALVVGLNEDSQLALLPVFSLHHEIGNENGESAVVVKPVDVNKTILMVMVKQIDALKHASVYLGVLELDELSALVGKLRGRGLELLDVVELLRRGEGRLRRGCLNVIGLLVWLRRAWFYVVCRAGNAKHDLHVL